MAKVNIGIIGYGFVGQAVAYGFSEENIRYYDKFKESESLESVIKESEFIFIGLPTPMHADESGIDLSIIEDSIAEITPLTDNTDKIIIIKSTVIPGTTEKLQKKYPKSNFCFNPEFLREASYLEDFTHPDRTIIGATNDLVSRRVVVLYKNRFPNVPIYQTDPTSAEMVKYMANTYLALKVIFANQMYDLCQKLGVKYEEVKKMTVADPRIFDSHLDITSMRGFGGKCFPKDTVALLGLASNLDVSLSVIEEAWKVNKKTRKIHDWEEIPFATSEGKKD
jgi:nucleotide sugar dehydrogenase